MKSRTVGCLAGFGLALGCAADTQGLTTLTVAELAAWLAADPAVVVCDANTSQTRRRFGVVPGARLLSNYRDYDPATELPDDKSRPLVFYCHSERCGAAVTAARKAAAAGHTRVAVLPPGILRLFLDAGHMSFAGDVRAEMRRAGYRRARSFDFLPTQLFEIFAADATPR